MRPTGLYLHVPYCQTKCGYCDFFSVPLKDRRTSPLISAMLTELQSRVGSTRAKITTIFVGGGTPTVLPVGDLARLMDAVAEITRGHPVEEFTVEANPATLDDEKLSILRRSGVDRLSMGAQSWHPAELEVLERLHVPGDIALGVKQARAHGFERINLDLIFGIPGQTLATWDESLRRTMGLGVEHVACYGLTYESGTRLTAQLRAKLLTPCDPDLETDMYLHAIEALAAAGYEQYEISNFVKRGEECRHNLIYWRNEPYIGVGPSAAGYIDGRRYKNVSDIAGYLSGMKERGLAEAESEVVSGAALAGETVMMQLRLVEGIDVGAFHQHLGMDPRKAFGNCLSRFIHVGLMQDSGRRIALTGRGRLVADTIISDIYKIGRASCRERV